MTRSNRTEATCGCCEDTAPRVPRTRENAPGRARIDARVGTHAAFKADMLEQLARTGAMRRLTVRDDDDPTIALLDGWAGVLDVLGFYQEELTNEGFLRTAEDRLSVRQMAAGVGYKLKPGVGSDTWLAFDCEVTPSTPDKITVPAGTQAQSTPAPEEMPQAFETQAELIGRPRWNALRPRLTEPVTIGTGTDEIFVAGTDTGLEPGLPLLFVAAGAQVDPATAQFDLRYVQAVDPFSPPTPDDPRPEHTRVRLDAALDTITAGDAAEVYVLRQRAAAFGHNAMEWHDLPLPLRVGELNPEDNAFMPGPYATQQLAWADALYDIGQSHLFLDQVYPRLVAESWMVVGGAGLPSLYRITGLRSQSHNGFLISAKVTRLSIQGEGIQFYSPRTASVLCQSERLPLAARPLSSPVAANAVTLNVADPDLTKGRVVALRGQTPDGTPVSEVVTIAQVDTVDGLTRLTFETDLQNTYDRLSLRINANVAAANMGASRSEVLGSADAARGFQSFRLQSVPLSYVSSSGGTGAHATLEVRVDGELWEEVDTFYRQSTSARVYTLTQLEDGAALITFGDGRMAGARPASGQSNVTARLRVGNGTEGNLDTGRIDQLTSRPLGVKAVINPVPASGAADAEVTADARRNAALQTRLIDRIVTLTDYQDFAAAFSGIGKARAQTLWTRSQRLVHITIAGADGAAVLPTDTLYQNLRDGIDLARHSDEPVSLGSYMARRFTLAADLVVRSDLIPEDVAQVAAVHVAQAFSFATRGFGQAVTRSEVMSVLHDCPGVEGVVLRTLAFVGQAGTADRLPADLAQATSAGLVPAELLLVDPVTLDLKGTL